MVKIAHIGVIGACAACVALLGACSKQPEPGPPGAGGKRRVVIGFIGKALTNDVFQAAQAGAQDAARELGPKYHVDVQLEVRTPNEEDATKQAEAVEALTRQGAEGIALSCSEANTVTPAIDQAAGKGVAVMCFDSDAAESRRFAYYGTDGKTCGQRVMDELAKTMGEKGTVAILGGNQSAPNLQSRVAGVKEAIAKYPHMKLNDPATFYHAETPEKAAEAVAAAQNANPGIGGWGMIGGWPLFTADALKWPPGTVKVVSVDALPAELNYLRDGHAQVLLAQDCYGWGSRSVETLLEKIVNQQSPAQAVMIDPLTRVTRDNVDEYAKNWDQWLGRK